MKNRTKLEKIELKIAGLGRRGLHIDWELGREFVRAKALVEHGQWIPWIESQGFGERSVQRRMELFESYPEIAALEGFKNASQALKALRAARAAERNKKAAALQAEKAKEAEKAEKAKAADEGETGAPPLKAVKRVKREPTQQRQALKESLVEELGLVCQGCMREFDHPAYLEVDHKMPRSDGGTNDRSNRTLLCRPCNGRKSNQLTLSGLVRANKRDGFWRG